MSKVLVSLRWGSKVGQNFDLVTGCDLTKECEQNKVTRYINAHRVQVTVVSPICAPFGGWGRMNRVLFPETWQRNAPPAIALGKFRGRVALHQLHSERDYVNEQPLGSDLYDYHPWPAVRGHARTCTVSFDQCHLGTKSSDRPL